ncbi:MAG: class I SAM-dependent methyltransferase [Vicinamibacterales bacterium]
MHTSSDAHSDRGWKRLLRRSRVYSGLRLLGRLSDDWVVRELIRPVPGCRILDLGCGPGDLAEGLKANPCEYVGVDFNPEYIDTAQRRHAGAPHLSFVCADLSELSPTSIGQFDVVTAIGLLHHLADQQARDVAAMAHAVLKPAGRLVTYDGVFVEGQHSIARFLLAHDRGRAVRTVEGYRRLVRPPFEDGVETVMHDTLRLPYTILAMTLTKAAIRGPADA